MKRNQFSTTTFMSKKKSRILITITNIAIIVMILLSNPFLHTFFIPAKYDFELDDLLPNQNLHPGIGTHLPTELVYEVLLYIWKYWHALKLKFMMISKMEPFVFYQ